MPEPAGLAAHAREFAIGVVEEIRHDEQQRRKIRPEVGAGQEAARRRQTDREADRGQVIWRNPAILQGRYQPSRESRVPRTLNRRTGKSMMFEL